MKENENKTFSWKRDDESSDEDCGIKTSILYDGSFEYKNVRKRIGTVVREKAKPQEVKIRFDAECKGYEKYRKNLEGLMLQNSYCYQCYGAVYSSVSPD